MAALPDQIINLLTSSLPAWALIVLFFIYFFPPGILAIFRQWAEKNSLERKVQETKMNIELIKLTKELKEISADDHIIGKLQFIGRNNAKSEPQEQYGFWPRLKDSVKTSLFIFLLLFFMIAMAGLLVSPQLREFKNIVFIFLYLSVGGLIKFFTAKSASKELFDHAFFALVYVAFSFLLFIIVDRNFGSSTSQ